MKSVSALSYAKINLTLDVFSRQKGQLYHPIRSVIHKISFADEITIQEHNQFEIHSNTDIPPKENLIFRAYDFVHKFYSKKLPPVLINLKKNIPIGGGMGGGSSNFATSVQLLHDLFGLGKVPAELVTQSAKYGKDIPFFFSHQTCLLSEGFGEVLSPLPFDFHNKKLILYSPPFSSSTVEAYARLKNLNTSFTERFLAQPTLNNIGNSFDEMFSLEMYQKLSSQFTGFHITGSGSCFWGLEKNDFRNCEIIETRFL